MKRGKRVCALSVNTGGMKGKKEGKTKFEKGGALGVEEAESHLSQTDVK